jgi:hypothetical protein
LKDQEKKESEKTYCQPAARAVRQTASQLYLHPLPMNTLFSIESSENGELAIQPHTHDTCILRHRLAQSQTVVHPV